MSAQPTAAPAPATPSPTTSRFIVRVRDDIDARLAGHPGGTYTSPPQDARDAAALAQLLIGRPVPTSDPTGNWSTATAGGRRLVAITPAE